MKSILLTSTALVAFAGAAAADGHAGIAFSGSAALGYNDTDLVATPDDDDHNGFYADMNLDVTMSATLDNGVTVSATADVDELDASDAAFGGVTLSIASDIATLTYGDTSNSGEKNWSSVGSMDNDGFYEQDGEEVLRGDITFGDIELSVSTEVVDGGTVNNNNDFSKATNMNLTAGGSFGSVSGVLAYQEGDATRSEIFGVRASTTFAGFDVALGYADTDGDASTGVSLGYTVGPVALAASYVMEGAAGAEDNWDISATYSEGAIGAKVYTDESEDWGAEFSYDVGNGLSVYAGVVDGGEDTYVGGSYDLGGGASLLVSYADDGDNDEDVADDDIGPNDYQVGTTIAVSFTF